MSFTDSLGNPVTVGDATSLPAIDAFVEGFISCEARAVDALAAAGDASPMVQAYCATLHLFAESGDARANAGPFLERALEGAARATPREQRYIEAIAAWSAGDIARAVALHQEQAREHPRDLASLKLGQYHCFNTGDCPGMLRLALAALPAAADVPYLHGMAAFGYEQCHLLREAEASARRAITLRRKEPWAHHALGHVMLTEGRLNEGLAVMRALSDTWVGLNSFMVTHNWWHVALFLIDLGRADEALAIYDREVWGVVKDYSQDQIGAVSLLARFELAGIPVGDRWQDVANHLARRLADHVLPFLDLQYLYGLARAGRDEADLLLRNIEAFAPAAPPSTRAAWQRVCVPAAHGLLAHARGDFAAAIDGLGQALPQLARIGGSHAQRDLFEQVYLDALVRLGTAASLAEAQGILQQQLNGQPESLRLRRQAAAVYARLGLPAFN
ncbi:tetratricopeptide repeat protein [Variovorax saccharolyticus]|uniref:tetratricopeptide repeat protein n=1 Tax=Variovorax saccharolyticus TaxID=3053516 RepID=UPI002578C5F0|nr:tetratricopeptide repeat protein [Variovorax sp. J31P216]MDM0025807.1 tetratricopeptide repeat protein [Variovorax sp. J31P216]